MNKLNILLLVFLFHLASISLYAQENKTKIVIANERESSTFHHTVEKGETVYAIATMYGVKPEDIYRLNPGSKEGIRAGATLQIPQRTTASQKEEHYIYITSSIPSNPKRRFTRSPNGMRFLRQPSSTPIRVFPPPRSKSGKPSASLHS